MHDSSDGIYHKNEPAIASREPMVSQACCRLDKLAERAEQTCEQLIARFSPVLAGGGSFVEKNPAGDVPSAPAGSEVAVSLMRTMDRLDDVLFRLDQMAKAADV